jgi:hypothetical protein
MSDERWYYFLSIEKDFIRTTDYVELHPDNSKSFSNEYAKLLLLIGSEVDVVAKMLCARETPQLNRRNIVEYRIALTGHFKDFHTIEIELARYKRKIQPWLSWGAKPPTPPVGGPRIIVSSTNATRISATPIRGTLSKRSVA